MKSGPWLRHAGGIGAIVSLLLGGPARAQSPPPGVAPPRIDSAPGTAPSEETLISRGVELREKGDDAAALGAFRAAYALAKSAHALAQIALAEQALGQWVDAEAHLLESTRHLEDPWISRNKALLDPALTEIQGHVGSLELSGGVAGAELRFNGVLAGTLPLTAPVRLPAGSVALEVRAPGYLPVVRSVIIPSRGLAREPVVLVAIVPTTPTPSAAPGVPNAAPNLPAGVAGVGTNGTTQGPGWTGRKKVALGLGVAAVAGLGVGATFMVIRDGRAKDFNNAGCYTGNPAQTDPCASFKDKEQSALTVGIIGLAGAAVLGGIGAYLLLTDRAGGPPQVALAGHTITWACQPSSTAGVVCQGAF
jgi:hypothetical protein